MSIKFDSEVKFGTKLTKKGFTLVELLVVIALIGILASIVIAILSPVKRIQQARDRVRQTSVKHFELGLQAYLVDNGYYPPETKIDTSVGSSNTCSNSDVIAGTCGDLVPGDGWDSTSEFYTELIGGGYLINFPPDPVNSEQLHIWYEPRPAPCLGDTWNSMTSQEDLNPCYPGGETAKDYRCGFSPRPPCMEFLVLTHLEVTDEDWGCGNILRYRGTGRNCGTFNP